MSGLTPVAVHEVELAERLPVLHLGCGRRRAFLLIRLHAEPIGTLEVDAAGETLAPELLAVQIWAGLGGTIRARFAAAGIAPPIALPVTGLGQAVDWPDKRRQANLLTNEPFISVIVCTRDRPVALRNCLSSLGRQQYPQFEVVVVDNAPTSDAVARMLAEPGIGVQGRYVVEPRPGLSWARNAGIAAATGDIVAFVDDDDEADPCWLIGIADGFRRGERIGCVTGSVLPARLDTPAQILFEQLGGHRKGRGFTPMVFSRSGPQHPLFPLPPFGAGANMAFRKEALRSIGGFDVALGAGTPTAAGEDTLAMALTLLAGYQIAYEPAAVMWHHHRRDLDGLRRQLHGYSVGLTAFYAAVLRHRPTTLLALLGLVPEAARYLRSLPAARSAIATDTMAELDRKHGRGLLRGPAAYLRSLRIQRRLA